ncbi:putative flagellar biosynthesis protein [Halobacteriovorax marinus SJ]|uniref:Flagellar biosynthesis protein n=2 Tax=Halobacteriovorax marinus TaxID=97084 RepID=E1X4P4_HALMS|nr:putative flagellar biosynthesis protein [Halobacteriovorax marinus SJ]
MELGPDAIILKTITNKGLKGAFKKKKIEITAAISEKNYSKKAKVDHILDDGQKGSFYSNNSSYISNMIDGYESNTNENSRATVASPSGSTGYGKLGLNKTVNTNENQTAKTNDLDDFLSDAVDKVKAVTNNVVHSTKATMDNFFADEELESMSFEEPVEVKQSYEVPHSEIRNEKIASTSREVNYDDSVVVEQRKKIDDLEKKLFELTKNVERLDKKEPNGIYELRATLRSLDISEKYIHNLVKKAIFEMSRDELEDSEVVFEFALREMLECVNTEMPLFSSSDSEQGVVTVILSETSTGQTSMAYKIGALKPDSTIVRSTLNGVQGEGKEFSRKLFGLNVSEASNIAETVSLCRKTIEEGKCAFIDYKNNSEDINETKKFIDGLRRSFGKVEVLVSLSAIHSEIYNRKVVSRYKSLANGIVISNLDLCLNFGALFNITEENSDLPLKFYGTGEVVPDDLEAATAERLLAGIFQF